MQRILITGMSGTGKSTVIGALAARGYYAVDLDQPGFSEHAHDGDWIWNVARVRDLLANQSEPVLFVSGCAENQGQFYPQFDAIVLLSAPQDVIIERLRTRITNSYGKQPEELADTLHYLKTVEPRLRRCASHEIDATLPLEQVVARLEALVQ